MVSESSLGLKSIFIIFLLAGLFFVSLYQFGLGVASEYGQTSSLISDSRLDMSGLEAQLNNASANANEEFEAFSKDNLFSVLGDLVLYSVWGVWHTISSTIKAIYTILTSGMVNVLGFDPMVIGVITAILLISLIFAGWRLLKQGE